MINLSQTTDKIQMVLGGAVVTNQAVFYVAWRQTNQPTDTEFTPERNTGTTNNTTQVDMVAAPASGKQRLIETINVYNADTATMTVTVILDANGI